MSRRTVAGLGRRGTPAATSQLCTVCGATPYRAATAAIVIAFSTYSADNTAASGRALTIATATESASTPIPEPAFGATPQTLVSQRIMGRGSVRTCRIRIADSGAVKVVGDATCLRDLVRPERHDEAGRRTHEGQNPALSPRRVSVPLPIGVVQPQPASVHERSPHTSHSADRALGRS